MKLRFGRGAAALALAISVWLVASMTFTGLAAQEAQEPQVSGAARRTIGDADRSDLGIPNGKSQRDEILKDEHEKNLSDARKLAELSQQLRDDLEKNGHSVFSVTDLRKTDEIEKLAKQIHGRMRH